MKYKVGDVVKLRDDLEDYRTYNELWAGKISTIKKNPVEIKDIEFDGIYRSSTGWIINDEMIEGLWEECKNIEVELIEPQEPTDNTKIEELEYDDFWEWDPYGDGYEQEEFVGTETAIKMIFAKLNEVIRKINKEG